MGPIVCVEGLVGAGKSTLVQKIAKSLDLRALMEPVEDNPYLERFYLDQKRWAFSLQIEMLHRRYCMQKLAAYEATSEGGYRGAVLDRGLPGDRVFAQLHVDAGNIDPLEWATYERAFDAMVCSLLPPTVLLFLDVEPEVALDRVRQRARGCEATLTLDYLKRLHRGYLDLLVEIESGEHPWSRGVRVLRVPWNRDDQSVDGVVQLVQVSFDAVRARRTIR